MIHSAETEVSDHKQQQSIAERNLTTQAGIFEDEEVVALGEELDTATVFYGAAGTEQVDFRLAGQLRGSRRGAAVRADFTRRLQANEPAVSLASYDFSNEPNVLTLSFSNDAQRDEFTQMFDVYLLDNSFLSAADPLERIQVVEPLTQNVVLRGHEGLNYAEPSSEQMLLSAAPEVLEGLIDRYAETIVGGEDATNIELQMGETKIEGLESIRRTVRAMAVPEVQRPMFGEEARTADKVDDAAADPDERLTAAQWREHFARLGLPAKTNEGQASGANQSGADKDGRLAEGQDESGRVAGAAQGEQTGSDVSSDRSPGRAAAKEKTFQPKGEVRQEEQAAAAGEKDQGEVGLKKKRRARSAKGMRSDEIELFGGLDTSPPASDSADGGSRGRGGGGGGVRGGGGGDALKQLKRPGPLRPIGRASNLTFVLKLQTVPLPEMGPPAPRPESDDPEE